MYDFCLTLPYGVLLAIGGLIGAVTKGSVPSLVAGLTSGTIMMGLGYVSLAYYKKGQLCKAGTGASLVMSAAMTGVMYKRYQDTGKLFPAIFIVVISAAMTGFYLWSLLLGPRPLKKQKSS